MRASVSTAVFAAILAALLAPAAPASAQAGPATRPAASAFNLWLPGAGLELWRLPGGGGTWAGAELRLDLVYAIDRSAGSGSWARGRWERYLEVGAFFPLEGGDPFYLALYGMNGSLERAGSLRRSFLIPYAGMEAGLAFRRGSLSPAVLPLIGCAILSLPGLTCSLECRALLTGLSPELLGAASLRLVAAFTL